MVNFSLQELRGKILKVAKFGGSSLADASQFKKVASIVEADPMRKIIVVSASGKRNKEDNKITDLLYLCYAHLKYSVSCESIWNIIEERYLTAYKRIRGAARNGLAVVMVDRDACGGCFNKIPHQRQMEIKMHKKVIVCEHCGRILVDQNIADKVSI